MKRTVWVFLIVVALSITIGVGKLTNAKAGPPGQAKSPEDRAAELLVQDCIEKAMEQAASLKEPNKKVIAYLEIAQVQRKTKDKGRSQKTLALAKLEVGKMEQEADKAQLFKEIACEEANAGDISAAKETTAKIRDENRKTEANWAVALAQAETGDVAGAKETAAQIPDETKEWVYVGIAREQAKGGNTIAAKETAEQILGDYLRTCAYAAIAEQRARVGDARGAKEASILAKKEAEKIQSQSRRYEAYYEIGKAGEVLAAIAKTQLKEGKLEEAKATAEQIANAAEQTEAYTALAEARAEAGDAAGARELIRLAISARREIDYGWMKDWAYEKAIAKAQVKVGDISGAEATAEKITDPQGKFDVQMDIAEALALRGEVRQAEEVAEKVGGGDEQKESIFQIIALAQAKAKDFAGAKDTIEKIMDKEKKAVAYANMAECQAQAQHREEASKTISLAKSEAQSIRAGWWKDWTHFHICGVQVRIGDITGAQVTAGFIDDTGSRASAYAAIARLQAKAGDMEGARRTAALAKPAIEDIIKRRGRGEPIAWICEMQMWAGDTGGAKETLACINRHEDPEYRIEVYMEVCWQLLQEKEGE